MLGLANVEYEPSRYHSTVSPCTRSRRACPQPTDEKSRCSYDSASAL